MNNLNLDGTIILQKNYEALIGDKRFIINQGSSRSSKSISICQLLIVYALTNKNKVISIVRKTLPALKATALRDFIQQLKQLDLYSDKQFNKSDLIYTFDNGTIIEFFSVDQADKIRGRKRHICWVEESQELYYDDFLQLNLRTIEKMFFSYNPSDSSSWLYELPSDESILIKSTYKDNPYLETSLIKQIEQLQYTDQALWSIYGLGERCMSKKNVYTHWQFVSERPPQFQDDKYVYGIDFGYNHPTALSKVYYYENQIYIEKVLYERYLTTAELIDKLNSLGLNKEAEYMADTARPEIIAELRNNGYNVLNANKNVKQGIGVIKARVVYANDDPDIKKEYENYQWKTIGDQITDEPIKLLDDLQDATRYACQRINQAYSNDDSLLKLFF